MGRGLGSRSAWLWGLIGWGVGCGAPPPTPAVPTETATPTWATATPAPLRCDAPPGAGTLLYPGTLPNALGAAAVPAVQIPALFNAPGLSGPVTWRVCSASGVAEWRTPSPWAALAFDEVGAAQVLATDERGAAAWVEVTVYDTPGEEVRFRRDVALDPSKPRPLDQLPWPSTFFQGEDGRILIDRDSVEHIMPNSLTGLGTYIKKSLVASWEQRTDFPRTVGITLPLAGDLAPTTLPTEVSAFTLPGAPAWLMELPSTPAAPGVRLPLEARYVAAAAPGDGSPGGEAQSEGQGRSRLELWLPEGRYLKERTSYLWVVTTSLAGEGGPARPAPEFSELLAAPPAPGDPTSLRALREALNVAMANSVDLPSLSIIAAAGTFTTGGSDSQLPAIEACVSRDECDGVDVQGETPGPARPVLSPRWTYDAEVPREGDTQEGPRSLARLMRQTGTCADEDLATDLYPCRDYSMVLFGDLPSPRWQPFYGGGLTGPFPVGEGGRVTLQGWNDLRFTLILPGKEYVASGRAPVVTFVHGLGQDQMDAFKMAEFLAPHGFAVLAIDQVAHGSRLVIPDPAVVQVPGQPPEPEPTPSPDHVNNFLARQAAYDQAQAEDQGDETPTPRGPGLPDPPRTPSPTPEPSPTPINGTGPDWQQGDGLADAVLSDTYEVLAILGFFNWLQNFPGMGDNFRQAASDVMRLERMVEEADETGGLNERLLQLGSPVLIDPNVHLTAGRSLGAISLATHLYAARGPRAAALGVPGAGVVDHLTAHSPFVGSIIVAASEVVECLNPDTTCDVSAYLDQPIVGTEYLRPGDLATHLLQGLLEAGDPALTAQGWFGDGQRHVLMQHVCDDEVVPNPSTELLAQVAGVPAFAPVDVGPGVGEVAEGAIFLFDTFYHDLGDNRDLQSEARLGVQGNLPGGETAALLSYCPGTHGELYDRDLGLIVDYGYYPDGPFFPLDDVAFAPLSYRLETENALYDAREAMVNFLLTYVQSGGSNVVITAPGVPQLDDLDSDGLPADKDPCPWGANPSYNPNGAPPACD